MRIRSLTLKNFRKFTEPVTVRGFGPGVNVLAERNEFGKSTLLAAINGVIFQRYKSTADAVKSFSHHTHQAAPEVRLELEVGGEGWAIEKRFSGASGKALLVGPGGQRFENDAAEKRLQELLGFGAGTRAAEPGIWGTLWVAQGQSFAVPALDDRSLRTIQDCLAAEVGALTGGRRGRSIPASVNAALDELWTSRGAPRGRFKQAHDRRAEVTAELAELEQKRGQLERWLLDRADKRVTLEARRASGKEQELEANRRQAEEEKARVAVRETELAAARDRLRRLEAELGAAEREAQDRKERALRLAALEDKGRALVEQRAALDERLAAIAAQIEAVAIELTDEGERVQLAEDELARAARTRDALAAHAGLDRQRASLARVDAIEEELGAITREVAGLAVDDKAMKRIAAAVDEHSAAEAALSAVATLVELSLLPAAAGRVTVDGKAPPEGPLRLLGDAAIDIDGIGRIVVRPRIADRETLLAREAQARSELARLLAAARCATVDEARHALARRKELEGRRGLLATALAEAAPGDRSVGLASGTPALRQWVVAEEARLGAELSSLGLSELPPLEALEQTVSAATRRRDEARREAGTIERKLASLREEEAAARATRKERAAQGATATSERDELARRLELDRARVTDDALERAAEQLRAQVTGERAALDAALAAHEQAGESTEAIALRIRRFDEALASWRRTDQQLELELRDLAARIDVNEGDGIDEELDEKRAEAARLDEEIAACEAEAETLRLLSDVLREAERTAGERYLEPVLTRVEPYLRTLLPQARLTMSPDDLTVQSVERGPLREELLRLSDGTREQIAVLTRLAFARTLLDKGRPAMVILDDALVFSDDQRMDRMFDILQRAGQHMQILVLTCRERVFAELGGTQLRVEPVLGPPGAALA